MTAKLSTSDRDSRRILLFNLATDERDPILGFAARWVKKLSERVAAVDVVTMRAGTFTAPGNVRVFSVGKEAGYSELKRTRVFYRTLSELLGRSHYDVCFAHMMPLFAVMASPLLKRRRIPTVLWYAHKSTTRTLWLAERLVDRVVTSSPEGFRLSSSKVKVVGQGIDTELFSPASANGEQPTRELRLSTVGRLSPIKRIEDLIGTVEVLSSRLNLPVRLRLIGPVLPGDSEYVDTLRRSIRALGVEEAVEFVGAVQGPGLRDEYRGSDIFLNASDTDTLDKAALEAMSCGVPVISSNAALASLLAEVDPLLAVPKGSPPAFADACIALMSRSGEQRAALGVRLRQVIERDHSLDRLIDVLLSQALVFP